MTNKQTANLLGNTGLILILVSLPFITGFWNGIFWDGFLMIVVAILSAVD